MVARPVTIWAYPWDLAEQGASTTARYLKDDLGVSGVRIAFAYHSFHQLRPRSPGRHLVGSLDACIYFTPDLPLYVPSGIAPRPSPMLHSFPDMARSVARACKREGLRTIGWIVPLHASRMAVDYPHIRSLNAFDEPIDYSICPANPSVLAYLDALARDIARDGTLDAIDLEMPCWNEPVHAAHPKVGVELSSAAEALLGMCFCRHCVTRAAEANVDAMQVKVAIAAHLRKVLREGRSGPESFSELAERIPGLAAYQQVRRRTILHAVARVRESSGLPVHIIDLQMGPVAAMEELPELASCADGLVVLAYAPDPAVVRSVVAKGKAAVQGAEANRPQLTAGLSLAAPENLSEEHTRLNLQAAWEAGADAIALYNLGIAPESVLDWVKRALKAS